MKSWHIAPRYCYSSEFFRAAGWRRNRYRENESATKRGGHESRCQLLRLSGTYDMCDPNSFFLGPQAPSIQKKAPTTVSYGLNTHQPRQPTGRYCCRCPRSRKFRMLSQLLRHRSYPQKAPQSPSSCRRPAPPGCQITRRCTPCTPYLLGSRLVLRRSRTLTMRLRGGWGACCSRHREGDSGTAGRWPRFPRK